MGVAGWLGTSPGSDDHWVAEIGGTAASRRAGADRLYLTLNGHMHGRSEHDWGQGTTARPSRVPKPQYLFLFITHGDANSPVENCKSVYSDTIIGHSIDGQIHP